MEYSRKAFLSSRPFHTNPLLPTSIQSHELWHSQFQLAAGTLVARELYHGYLDRLFWVALHTMPSVTCLHLLTSTELSGVSLIDCLNKVRNW